MPRPPWTEVHNAWERIVEGSPPFYLYVEPSLGFYRWRVYRGERPPKFGAELSSGIAQTLEHAAEYAEAQAAYWSLWFAK